MQKNAIREVGFWERDSMAGVEKEGDREVPFQFGIQW